MQVNVQLTNVEYLNLCIKNLKLNVVLQMLKGNENFEH